MGTGDRMNNGSSVADVLAVKDSSEQRSIPNAWRPVFSEIVRAYTDHDYKLKSGVPGVDAVSAKTAAQVENYIRDYGATLVALPEEAWNSSVCIWAGSHWDVLVDLWTREEGPSDLVLGARVVEAESGFSFQVQMVYVP